MIFARDPWLRDLVLAECLDDRGRFLPTLVTVLRSHLAEPCWVLPAHDADLSVFRQQRRYVDLRAAMLGANLAQTLWLLGDRLPADLRAEVAAAVRQRVLDPVRASFASGKGHWWLTGTNNWNAVCLSGVVSAALTLSADPQERATFLAAAERYGINSITGYRQDGYNDEGAGYHSFGFGHLVLLRERVLAGSGGAVDLFKIPKVAQVARFGSAYQLTGGLTPTFADSRAGLKVNATLNAFVDAIFGGPAPTGGLGSGLCESLLTPTPVTGAATTAAADPLRSYWASVGVLVARPGPQATTRLAVAIKAGGNSSHSHNDIGSYCLSLGDVLMAGDPGGPGSYRADTFGPKRLTKYRLLNSFGHPVPEIAGQGQVDATKVRPQVLETAFSPAKDVIRMDLTTAYAQPAVTRVERTCTYERQGAGRVVIADTLAARQPVTFASAFTTRATIEELPDGLRLTSGKERLRVTVTASRPVTIIRTVIEELDAPPFTRLAFVLAGEGTDATCTVTCTPEP